jgi:alcohol dehydrogenase (cytochrome c)
MVTSGNIAVYGTMDRWFKVVDARNGNVLYKFHSPSGYVGQPITYQGKDGNQYLAMLSGVGGWAGALANAPIDPRVPNGALGYTHAVSDLPAVTSGGSTLMVFALPPQQGVQNAPH